MATLIGSPLSLALSSCLLLALGASLLLVLTSLRRPRTVPLAIAGALVLSGLVVGAISPVDVSPIAGIVLALVGIAVSVLGGNPVTRRILAAATDGRVVETADGGILLKARDGKADAERTLLRGGTVIGYLERVAVTASIIVGFPEALAAVVAVKGIGRFSELANAEARERFIIGTLASLVWAGAVGGLVRLAMF